MTEGPIKLYSMTCPLHQFQHKQQVGQAAAALLSVLAPQLFIEEGKSALTIWPQVCMRLSATPGT